MRKSRSHTKLQPIHPGEILREDYMKPLRLSMNQLAMALHVPVTRITEIVHERRSISADTALRLARYFKTSAKLWLNLQAAYDLEITEDRSLSQIEREVQVRPAAQLEA
jgi:addiction module HigA family antidote